MEYEILLPKIVTQIKKTPNEIQPYQDLFAICRAAEDDNFDLAHDNNALLRQFLANGFKLVNEDKAAALFETYRMSLLFDARYNFDCYLKYLEIDRKPEERFYLPRRRIMKRVVNALNDLTNDKLDELFTSMPPRVGKTTVLMMYATWLIGRNSELSNLYCSYSDTITSSFYNGVMEVIDDPDTYLWHEIFPESKIVSRNSKDETLNIDRNKRYPSLTCRSIFGTLNGACDATGIIIADDLVEGIEVAMNKDRLAKLWATVDNNLITRAKESCKLLWCGTRWSIIDPIGMRMDLLVNDDAFKNKRKKVIELPALDENDESLFFYDYNVGFSTEYYRQRRASFERNDDMASWNAQYEQKPIERDGALFSPSDMRFYNGELPDTEPDRIFMATDPAWGGGDFVASPVCYQYDNDIYVVDVVYTNEDKRVSQPLLAQKAIKHSATAMQLELNKTTEDYKKGVENELKKRNYRMNLTSKSAPTHKAKWARILDKAPEIRENFIFLESGKRSKEYEMFIQNVFSYKLNGNNKHDDAPDSLSMAADMCTMSYRPQAMKRPC